MQTSDRAVDVIKAFEGFRPEAYICPGGRWTIGYGTTMFGPDDPVQFGDDVTEDNAETLLRSYIREKVEPALSRIFTRALTIDQRDALASFVYNLGPDAGKYQTLVKLVNEGADGLSVANQFAKYANAGGKPLLGLYRRRLAEGLIWNGQDWRPALNAILTTRPVDLITPPKPLPMEPAPPVAAASAPEPKLEPVPVPPPPPAPAPKSTPKPKPTYTPAPLPSDDGTTFTDLKSMVLSRRFWGWFLIIFGRVSMGSDLLATHAPIVGDVVRTLTGDSMMFEFSTGLCVMIAGETLRHIGEKGATKALK